MRTVIDPPKRQSKENSKVPEASTRPCSGAPWVHIWKHVSPQAGRSNGIDTNQLPISNVETAAHAGIDTEHIRV